MSSRIASLVSRHARHSTRPFVGILLGISMVTLSCDSSIAPREPGEPASLQIVSGEDQEGVVGEELRDPLVVRVVDEHGLPVQGQLVNWVVTRGGGRVFAGAALTNEEGLAKERWTLGTSTAEENVLEVRAVDVETGAGVVFARFTARTRAGAATSMIQVGTSVTQSLVGRPVTPSPTVRLFDRYDNPVPNAAVTFTPSTGGSVSPATVTTDETGTATTTWTLNGAPGPNTLESRHGVLPVIAFSTQGVVGPATRLVLIQDPPSVVQSGVRFVQQPALKLTDDFGNDIAKAGVAVTATIESGVGTLAGTRTVSTTSAGIASFTDLALSGDSPAYTLAFSSPGLATAISPEITMGGSAGALALEVQPPASTRSGEVFGPSPVLRLVDANGAPRREGGIPVTVQIVSGSGSLGGATTVTTDADGVAAFTGLSLSGESWRYVLAFSAPDLPMVTSRDIAMRKPGTLTLEKISGDLQTAVTGSNLPVPIVVRLVDYDGNPLAGQLVEAAVASDRSSGGLFNPAFPSSTTTYATANTASDGTATFHWRVGKQGTNTLTVWRNAVYPAFFTATVTSNTP